jgi:DNA-binding PadR family transcriptional regulator
MKIENTKAQMRKGVLEFCILAILKTREAYPSDIIEELKEAKLIVVEGTLYPLLTRLKNAGLLRSTEKVLFANRNRQFISGRIGQDLARTINRCEQNHKKT